MSSDSIPTWTARCFVPHGPYMPLPDASARPLGRPAPELVGRALAAVERAAAKDGFVVVIVGRDGQCVEWLDDLVFGRHHAYLALDAGDRVVAARVD